jgi:hypothetical protein
MGKHYNFTASKALASIHLLIMKIRVFAVMVLMMTAGYPVSINAS